MQNSGPQASRASTLPNQSYSQPLTGYFLLPTMCYVPLQGLEVQVRCSTTIAKSLFIKKLCYRENQTDHEKYIMSSGISGSVVIKTVKRMWQHVFQASSPLSSVLAHLESLSSQGCTLRSTWITPKPYQDNYFVKLNPGFSN